MSAPTWNEEFELPTDPNMYQIFKIFLDSAKLKIVWVKIKTFFNRRVSIILAVVLFLITKSIILAVVLFLITKSIILAVVLF